MLPTPDPTRDALARALGSGYAVERELGRGGMGIVYLARDLRLDRAVAVKVLPPELAQGPGGAEMRDRFLREARTAAQLAHPNIVPIHRADEAGGLAFFTMGFVDGETLADHVAARGALPPAEAVRCLREAAWALAYAHARGIVHRDVKPENIMLERGTGRVMVTDFGIARRSQDARLTADGHILGSVHFMSPEQIGGGALDGRSDLYALGVVGFYLLSGRLPFEGGAPAAVLVAHATQAPPPLRSAAPDVPTPLAAVIDRCLAKEPAERYATGEALADALGQALEAADAEETGGRAAPVLSEAQAAAVWRRAAHLQVEAAQRLEERSRVAARASADAEVRALAPTSGYRLRDVESAAVEAGISQQYVALALAELATPAGGVQAPAMPSDRTERLARLVLREQMRSMSVTTTVRAAPKRVLAAMGQALQGPPYGLVLKDTVGGHPLDGGILVFELPLMPMSMSMSGYHWLYLRQNCYTSQVRATLRTVPGGTEATEVTLTVDVQGGWKKNLRDAGIIAGLVGSGGAAIGAALGAAALAAAGPLLVLPGAAGFLVSGAVATGLMGPLYRWGLKKARAELDSALTAVAGAVRSQDVFGAPPPGRPPQIDGGDDDVLLVLS